MIGLKEVVDRSRRTNHEENLWIFPFSARVSKYFTWVFVNAGLNANQVTTLFFACGLGACVAWTFDTPTGALTAYLLHRLHVLFDVCDGEVARFHAQVSRFGVYWDQLIHLFTYPAMLAAMTWGRVQDDAAPIVVAAGLLATIARAVEVGLKNVFMRTLYQAGESPSVPDRGNPGAACVASVARTESPPRDRIRKRCAVWLVRASSLDAFFLLYVASFFVPNPWAAWPLRDAVLVIYAPAFLAVVLLKVVLTPRLGGLPARRSLR